MGAFNVSKRGSTMKKSSQITLATSLVLFLVAGSIKFWPEDRSFSASLAALTSHDNLPGTQQLSRGSLPVARSFAPGWAGSTTAPPNAAAPATPETPFNGTNPSVPGAFPKPPPAPTRTIISLTAKNMPVGQLLAQIFHQAGASFTLNGQMNEPVTITFDNMPFEQAVRQALGQTEQPRLRLDIENGVYVVGPVSYDAPQTPSETP